MRHTFGRYLFGSRCQCWIGTGYRNTRSVGLRSRLLQYVLHIYYIATMMTYVTRWSAAYHFLQKGKIPSRRSETLLPGKHSHLELVHLALRSSYGATRRAPLSRQ